MLRSSAIERRLAGRRLAWALCVWLGAAAGADTDIATDTAAATQPATLDSGTNAAGPAAADPEAALDARARNLADMEQRIRDLGTALAAQRGERQTLIAELEASERAIADLVLAGRDLDRRLSEQTRATGALRSRLDEERAALAEELTRLSGLLRTAHAMGRADWLRLILNQEDPVRASRILSYYAYLNRARLQGIAAVRTRAEHLAAVALDADREMARLAELAARQAAARAELETARQERALVLARLEDSIGSQTQDLETLERDTENLRLLIEQLRQHAQIAAESNVRRERFDARRGQLSWPVPGARLLAGFGSPRDAGSGARWDGVLLATQTGEEVRAVHDGRVAHADWLRGFGLLLVLDHGDGFMSLYGHNDALLREPGDWVQAGEVIALSGDSGGRGEPALYFAIRDQGQPRDPAHWCRNGG